MELFDLYDENRIKQNKTIQSGKKISCKLSNVIVKVCVFDSLGKKCWFSKGRQASLLIQIVGT